MHHIFKLYGSYVYARKLQALRQFKLIIYTRRMYNNRIYIEFIQMEWYGQGGYWYMRHRPNQFSSMPYTTTYLLAVLCPGPPNCMPYMFTVDWLFSYQNFLYNKISCQIIFVFLTTYEIILTWNYYVELILNVLLTSLIMLKLN